MDNKGDKKGRVIITSGRNTMALVAAHSLGKRGLEIIGADCIKMTMLNFSSFVEKNVIYENYDENPEKFLDDLEKIVIDNKPDDDRPYVLMPIFKETALLSKHKERFEKHIKVAAPDISSIDKVHPKYNLTQTANELGVNIPETKKAKDRSELDEIIDGIDFPVLIKPEDASGGRGIYKVKTQNELIKKFEDNVNRFKNTQLIQEIVEGIDFSFTGIFKNGEYIAGMAYKNLQTFPAESGSGVLRETVDENIFLEQAKNLVEPIGWNGVAQLDFIWNEDHESEPYLIEVNPRFWGGLFQSVKSGVDYPWLSYNLHAFGKVPPVKDRAIIGKTTKLPGAWLLAAIEESIRPMDRIEEIAFAGKNAFDALLQGEFSSAFDTFINGFKKGFNFDSGMKVLSEKMKTAETAENELLTKEDYQAAVGVLFIFDYLVKYKKLPPEVEL